MTDEIDAQELERRKRVAEWLASERERYEYLLQCVPFADHEELAWETIVARMTVEDFVTAAKEALAGRKLAATVEGLGAVMAGADNQEWREVMAALSELTLKSSSSPADTESPAE